MAAMHNIMAELHAVHDVHQAEGRRLKAPLLQHPMGCQHWVAPGSGDSRDDA